MKIKEQFDFTDKKDYNKYSRKDIILDKYKLNKQFYKSVSDKHNVEIQVYLVNGLYIRNNVCLDFTMGGHPIVYSFIPKNEIWIDKCSNIVEIDNILFHELVEYNLMKYTENDYPESHTKTSYKELEVKDDSNFILDFPIIRQQYNFSCSSASIQSVLNYYNFDIKENNILENIIKTKKDKKNGSSIKNMVNYLKQYNLKVYLKYNLTIDDLIKLIDKNIPTILNLQAYNTDNKYSENNYNDEHHATAIGYNKNKEIIIFSDPSCYNYTFLTYKDLELRWRGYDDNNNKINGMGIIVIGNNINNKSVLKYMQ